MAKAHALVFENSLNKICIRLGRVHHTGTHTEEGLREKAGETKGRIKAGRREGEDVIYIRSDRDREGE